MQTLLLWLQIAPALMTAAVQGAHAVETGFQTVANATGNQSAKTGAAKLATFEATLAAILDENGSLLNPDQVIKVAKVIVGKVVGIFNKLGWFKSTDSPAPSA